MKLAFTLCSNNFLAYALTLANSVLAKNPQYQIVIGLVDQKSDLIDYSRYLPHMIINLDVVGIPNLDWMISHYNIVELNTAVKPYYFSYLFRSYDPEHILFFDPDIYVYDSLETLTNHFHESDILLTPHVIKPIPVGVYPWENHFLKHGIYNLGFIGLKNTATTNELLQWWEARCAEHCLADQRRGLYVDQLWVNFVPLFFSNVHIDKSPGHNVAFWNLHERLLSFSNERFSVNNIPLVFFHFSSFDPTKPQLLTKEENTNYDYRHNPHILELLKRYKDALIQNGYTVYAAIPYAFSDKELPDQLAEISKKIIKQEQLLASLSLLGVNKEKVVRFMYWFFKHYLIYNNMLIKNRNDDRYNDLDYSFTRRTDPNLNPDPEFDFVKRLKLFRVAFRTFFGKN